MQSESNVLSCEHCGETFQRREHRDRHVLRHTGLKPFRCHICSKSFSRNDTLQRHRNLHRDRQDAPRSPSRRAVQACLPCARLKQRCDGKSPCSRCLVRSARCCYDPSRVSGPAKSTADSDRMDEGESRERASEETRTNPYPINSDDGQHLRPQATEMTNADPLPAHVQAMPGQWGDHRMVHSTLDSLPAISPDLVGSSSLEGADTWRRGSDLAAEGHFGGSSSDFIGTTDDLWVPWNPMAINFSLPWTLDSFANTLDQANLLNSNYHVQPIGQVSAFTPSASHDGTASSVAGASLNNEFPEGYSRDHSNAKNTNLNHIRPCRAFPKLKDASLELAATEMYGHVPYLPNAASQGLQNFYRLQRQESAAPFMHERILHAFVELYFEHFDAQFPFLHPTCLEGADAPWILLLAVAAVGSHYSEIPDAQRYNLALVDLLARAVDVKIFKDILCTDVVLVQAVFLLHVLWMFSGSHKEKVILQHKRSVLVSLCWDLLSKADPHRKPAIDNPDIEAEWRFWLSGEEEIRLLTCVRVFECLGSLFHDIPPIFKLRDATRQFPAPEDIWRCKDARSWKDAYQNSPAYQAERTRTSSQEDWSRTMLSSETFTCKAALIELLVDETTVARQLYSSRLLRASVASHLHTPNTSSGHGRESPPLTGLDSLRSENTLLDTSVDLLSYAALEGSVSTPHDQAETILHVLAILRRVSLEILHTATGWKTSKEKMYRSRTKFKDFCQRNPLQARRCLWHATRIFKQTRSSRKLACYDVYSIMICTAYIYCYCAFFMSDASPSRQAAITQRGTSANGSIPTVVRLDQLRDRSSIERWIESADEHHLIHLTGVGLLDGSDDCVRFLRDIERTLESQIAWRGICCAFAASFAQLRRGEMPTEPRPENDEDGSS